MLVLLDLSAAFETDYKVNFDGLSVSSSAAVKYLGVIVDSGLLFKGHVDNITWVGFFHRRNIAEIKNMMSLHDAEILVNAFVTFVLNVPVGA